MIVKIIKFAEKFSIVAPDGSYNIQFDNILERRNTRNDNPMVEIGQDYIRPTGEQRITIIPTSRPNKFEDYDRLTVDLSNDLAADILDLIKKEPQINMWFLKDQLSFAAKYKTLI